MIEPPGVEIDEKARVEVRAVVTHTDGTTTDLGVITAHYPDATEQEEWEAHGRAEAEARILEHNAKKGR